MKKEAVKYKAGDKVKVRTWEEMKNLYGISYHGGINPDIEGDVSFDSFMIGMEYDVKNLPNRIVTILEKGDNCYRVENSQWYFQDYMFEGSEEVNNKQSHFEPVNSRFEILDL